MKPAHLQNLLPLVLLSAAGAHAQLLSIALPERTRLLEDQRLDIVIEARNVSGGALKVTANGLDISRHFAGPWAVDLDCDTVRDAVWRAEMISFQTPGWVRLEATLATPQGTLRDVRDIVVQPFPRPAALRNVILYIGDGMTEAWRDAGRIVSRSVETVPGVPGLRQGFYDRLLEMDRMPVSGAIMHHSLDRLIPDSAPTATALATGNKTFDGGLSVFPDGTDCGFGSAADAATLPFALDNPRIETIAEYLKRRFAYRVGIITTASVADATPAAFGAHTGDRDTAFEIVRQYLENPFLMGQPVADVLMGGGGESFDPAIRADKRDMWAEFAAKGYQIVRTASELRGVTAGDGRVLGIFKTAQTTIHSSGVRAASTAHMNVAYDKLRLTRPGSESLPSFGGWQDQPFLDQMTQKAIEVLAGPDGKQPFFLMVEAASIDKQSHSNHFAGAAWDVIELDKAVGVGRAWAAARKPRDTLLVVTADHGQPMVIIGVAEIP
ncbi:MAG: alkaline phosphatase, partial [Bryobacteraceae bacterium]